MRTFSAAILAVTLLATNAYAAPLTAGKPAGVKKAQMENSNAILIVAGIGIVALGIGLAASSSGGGPTSVSSTTTGTP
jgi:hypothetical protein